MLIFVLSKSIKIKIHRAILNKLIMLIYYKPYCINWKLNINMWTLNNPNMNVFIFGLREIYKLKIKRERDF